METLTTNYDYKISYMVHEIPVTIPGFQKSATTEYTCGFFEMDEQHYIDVSSKIKVPSGTDEIKVYSARTRFIIPIQQKELNQHKILNITIAILADFTGKHLCLQYFHIATLIKGLVLDLPSLYKIYNQLKNT